MSTTQNLTCQIWWLNEILPFQHKAAIDESGIMFYICSHPRTSRSGGIMKYYRCSTDLIVGGDHDHKGPDWEMVTNLSCPSCHCFVLVYHPEEEEDE